MGNKLIVVSGMSGSGKTFLISQALRNVKDLDVVTAITTRETRKEESGLVTAKKSVSKKEFDYLRTAGKLCYINNVYGFYYAFDREEFDQKLKSKAVILEYNASLIGDIRRKYDDVFAIYIYGDFNRNKKEIKARELNKKRQEIDCKERNIILDGKSTVSYIDKLFENRYDTESTERFTQCINDIL